MHAANDVSKYSDIYIEIRILFEIVIQLFMHIMCVFNSSQLLGVYAKSTTGWILQVWHSTGERECKFIQIVWQKVWRGFPSSLAHTFQATFISKRKGKWHRKVAWLRATQGQLQRRSESPKTKFRLDPGQCSNWSQACRNTGYNTLFDIVHSSRFPSFFTGPGLCFLLPSQPTLHTSRYTKVHHKSTILRFAS